MAKQRLPQFPPLAWAGFVQDTPVIPKMYWDVYSSEQRWKTICMNLENLIEYCNGLGVAINLTHEDVEELREMFENMSADQYIDQLAEYIDNNLQAFVARLVAYVFPGLYWDGEAWRIKFVVPENWGWLKFRFTWSDDDHTYHLSLVY